MNLKLFVTNVCVCGGGGGLNCLWEGRKYVKAKFEFSTVCSRPSWGIIFYVSGW